MENGSIIDFLDSIDFLDLSTRTIQKIVKRAGLNCSICGWDEDSLDIHHIQLRSKGGTNELSNLVCLCPNCHRKAHSRKISIDRLQQVSMKDFDWQRYYRTSRVAHVNVELFIDMALKIKPKELSKFFNIPLKAVYVLLEKHKISVMPRDRKFDVSKEELETLIANNPLTRIGKMFGVSDNAIRKRCMKLGIELRSKRSK